MIKSKQKSEADIKSFLNIIIIYKLNQLQLITINCIHNNSYNSYNISLLIKRDFWGLKWAKIKISDNINEISWNIRGRIVLKSD